MNWTIGEIKSRGKATMKAGYWMCVLVSLILVAVSGGLGGISGGFSGANSGLQASKMSQENPGSLDISGDMDRAAAEAAELLTDANVAAIIGGIAVLFLIIFAVSFLIAIFLIEPLMVGCVKFFNDAGRERKYELGAVGHAFTHNYMNIVKIMFFMEIKIMLWSLLFIIPGIIKSYEYRMVPYLLGDNSDIDSAEAFARSKELMKGNKWHAFLLDLSFIGWIILDVLTCGILGIFYVNPYIYATMSELYLTLTGQSRTYGETGNGAGFDERGYTQTEYQSTEYQSTEYQSTEYQSTDYQQNTVSENPFEPSGSSQDNPFNTPY